MFCLAMCLVLYTVVYPYKDRQKRDPLSISLECLLRPIKAHSLCAHIIGQKRVNCSDKLQAFICLKRGELCMKLFCNQVNLKCI